MNDKYIDRDLRIRRNKKKSIKRTYNTTPIEDIIFVDETIIQPIIDKKPITVLRDITEDVNSEEHIRLINVWLNCQSKKDYYY